LQEFLRFLKNFRLLIYPVILIIVMLFRPQGLLGHKEVSFVKCYEWLKAGGLKKVFAKKVKTTEASQSDLAVESTKEEK